MNAPDVGAEMSMLLDEMLALRGATAAALVNSDGEVLASRGLDRALLERTVDTITSALAAGQALGELLGDGEGADDGLRQLMLVFGEGPILLTPLPGGERVMVLALATEQDLGRARLALRGNLTRLAQQALSA